MGLAVRSNSFRVNRNPSSSLTGGNTAGTVSSNFCKHIKYCCLHQNLTGRLDNEVTLLDRKCRYQSVNDGRLISLGSQFQFNELNTNNYSNFSDDEKSMKFNRKLSADANIIANHNKSLQQNYDSFENRKCNCGKLLCKCLRSSNFPFASLRCLVEWKIFFFLSWKAHNRIKTKAHNYSPTCSRLSLIVHQSLRLRSRVPRSVEW